MFKQLINGQIRDPKVLVIDENGTNLGVIDTKKAILMANEKDLDLVLFVTAEKTKSFPICKFIDYSRFAFQQKKKERLAKKNQVVVKVKEIKVKPQVGKNDLLWKSKQANDWLKQGYQVKFRIMTFGRIVTKTNLINQIYEEFSNLIMENGKCFSPLTKVSPIMYEATFIKKK